MQLDNARFAINRLFTIPLIFAAALLSFAHGANDVANAVGPLAAINEAVSGHGVTAKAAIPLWVMLIGALGIAIGLLLYGPKLIRTVGSEITELDHMRAFCIALAAALTVIVASQLGLPVSSTHIAVGGVFGVGFLREILEVSYTRQIEEIKHHRQGDERETVDQFLARFEQAPVEEKGAMLNQLKNQAKQSGQKVIKKRERKALDRIYRKQLVKRSILIKIVAAWLITVPASAFLGAMFYFTIRGMLLP
jgi:PiT family inorganic phosphate transporter